MILHCTGDEAKRTGADRRGFLTAVARRKDVAVHHCRKELIARFGQSDCKRAVVVLKAFDDGQRSELRGRVGILPAPFDGINNVLHLHGITVVEPNALTQRECIAQAIVRFCDLRGNSRNDISV